MLLERFLSKILVLENGCHEWQSTKHRQGYGKFWFDGKQVPAHRMAYELFKGEIPKDAIICHKCDNPSCVNPKHLYAGSYKTNAKDMFDRHRNWGNRKLKDEQVLQILELLETSRLSQTEIANKFNVSQITVSRLKLKQRHYLSSPNIKNNLL